MISEGPAYTADPKRYEHADSSGIYVRALKNGKWDAVDIAELDAPSLLAWVRSHKDDNWAEGLILILLGHGHASVDDHG